MVYEQPSIFPREWHTQIPLGFWHINGSTNLVQTTRPYNNNNYNKKRTCRIVDFIVPADHKVKLKECERRDKYHELARELKKVWNMSDDHINYNWCSWYNHQRIGTMTEGLGNNGTGGDFPNKNIVEIGQNTEKNPGDLLSLKLQWKTIS